MWTLSRAVDSFERHRERWDTLNKASGNHILLDSGLVSLLLRHFGSDRIFLAVCDEPDRPGMALVEKTRSGFWQTFQPSQAPLGLILLGSGHDVPGQMRRLIRSLPGYALGLAVLHQDPDYSAFAGLPPGGGVETVDYIRTARVTFSGTFEDYWKARDRHFVRDLARRRRRLTESGIPAELSTIREPGHVAQAIREYGRLETAGWKAELGTAISADNPQGAFYRELLEHFCERQEAVVYRLVLGGKTAAANLCLARDGMLVVLKTTYDESLPAFSPGRLLDEDMRRALFTEGRIKVEEYYGPFNESQGKWTDEVRTLFHVNVYRSGAVRRLQQVVKTSLAWLRDRRKPPHPPAA
jgi:hypothetical protein